MLDIFAIISTTTTIKFTPNGCFSKSDVCDANKNNTTGTAIKNFRVAVPCTPLSICSQKVNESYFPWSS